MCGPKSFTLRLLRPVAHLVQQQPRIVHCETKITSWLGSLTTHLPALGRESVAVDETIEIGALSLK